MAIVGDKAQRSELVTVSYTGHHGTCALWLAVVAGLVVVAWSLPQLGAENDATVTLVLATTPVVMLAVYALGRILYFVLTLGRRSRVELDPVRDRFGFPLCSLGGVFWEEGKLSEIDAILGGESDENRSGKGSYTLRVTGGFGSVRFRFASRRDRERMQKAIFNARERWRFLRDNRLKGGRDGASVASEPAPPSAPVNKSPTIVTSSGRVLNAPLKTARRPVRRHA
ncbi:MAG: hypothetical protein HQL51_07270 [Magnetococcales bacterium]|nr:hypothetical protein [Magnetococcales bacterium]